MVWVFPLISVCLECGVAQFDMPRADLEQFADGFAKEGQERGCPDSRRESWVPS